jgi:gluconate 2-dehydrogenase gamma chain
MTNTLGQLALSLTDQRSSRARHAGDSPTTALRPTQFEVMAPSRGDIIRAFHHVTHAFKSRGGYVVRKFPGTGSRLSRRELLKRAGFAGAMAAIPVGTLVSRASGSAANLWSTQADRVREPWETLTAAEADTLEAMAGQLIPSDANGPGAVEARAARYIDRALGGALASSRDMYRSGLASVDAYARTSKGAPFAALAATDQDAVLRDIEANVPSGFVPDAATFFNLVRAHTIQGTFCDPYYGGNANFVGWDLIGYPGIRLAVTANDQRLDPRMTRTRRSAYDYAMFSKRRPARAHAAGRDRWRLI